MSGRYTKAKRWLLLGAAVLVVLILAAGLRWRRDIEQSAIDPKQPFQVYHPPAAPDYARRSAWALAPANPRVWTPADPPADVFFVHPTTFDGGRNWNGPIDDPQSQGFLEHVILPNDAGPFARVGRLFAPRYRQASLYAVLSLKDDARQARAFAYGDVRRAFDVYLSQYNDGRPIVVAGVEQGGALVERLMSDELTRRPDLAARIAAVYVINAPALLALHGPGSPLPACARPGQPRCEIGWVQSPALDRVESRRILRRSLVWARDGQLEDLDGRALLCVNPLLGAQTDQAASARLNIGAANATGTSWDAAPRLLSRQVSAQCVDGLLQVSEPVASSLRRGGSWLERLKQPGFNLFYGDVQADALKRVAGLTADPAFRAPAPPIVTSIEVRAVERHRID